MQGLCFYNFHTQFLAFNIPSATSVAIAVHRNHVVTTQGPHKRTYTHARVSEGYLERTLKRKPMPQRPPTRKSCCRQSFHYKFALILLLTKLVKIAAVESTPKHPHMRTHIIYIAIYNATLYPFVQFIYRNASALFLTALFHFLRTHFAPRLPLRSTHASPGLFFP